MGATAGAVWGRAEQQDFRSRVRGTLLGVACRRRHGLCPACGGTRMVYDLMHGHLAQAWADNRLLLLAAPFALALLARWSWEGLRGRRWSPRLGRRTQAAILVTAVVWTVARNLVGP
ncbi:hypothetical protein SFUMM280S_02619 [Streptomyces fumanus]